MKCLVVRVRVIPFTCPPVPSEVRSYCVCAEGARQPTQAMPLPETRKSVSSAERDFLKRPFLSGFGSALERVESAMEWGSLM